MKQYLKMAYSLYILGSITCAFGLIFYTNVFISDNFLGRVSAFMIVSRSLVTIYIGLSILILGFFLTSDYKKVYHFIVPKLPKNQFLYITSVVVLCIYGLSIFLPAVLSYFFIHILLMFISIFLIIKLDWKYILGLYLVFLNAFEGLSFLFFFDGVSWFYFRPIATTMVELFQSTLTIIFLVSHLVLISKTTYHYVKKRRYQKDLAILSHSFFTLIVILIVSLSYQKIYYGNLGQSFIEFRPSYLLTNAMICLCLGVMLYVITHKIYFKNKNENGHI